MLITPSTLDSLTYGFHVDFKSGIELAPATWKSWASEMPSATKTEKYPFANLFPRFREWVGDRISKSLTANDYSLTNKRWEATVEVPREDIEDDRIGLWSSAMQDLGAAAQLLPEDALVDALIAGGSSLCYDGQYFFDTDHPVDPYDASKGVQANLLTSTALSEANYAAARAAMRNFKGDDGKRLRVEPNLLVVPPALERLARTLVQADHISQSSGSTQTNVYKGSAGVLVLPELTRDSATTWYLFDVSRAIKPLFWQKRIAPEFQMITSLQAEHVIKTDKFLWGARARGAAGYALWQLAVKCTA